MAVAVAEGVVVAGLVDFSNRMAGCPSVVDLSNRMMKTKISIRTRRERKQQRVEDETLVVQAVECSHLGRPSKSLAG